MPSVASNGIRIEYEGFGDPGNPALLLIMGFAAMAFDGDRTELLGSIEHPTLVIHGSEDPLISVDGGRHTAAYIPHSRLHVIDGMAHDLPEQLIPELAGLIASHCRAAETRTIGAIGRMV